MDEENNKRRLVYNNGLVLMVFLYPRKPSQVQRSVHVTTYSILQKTANRVL